MLVANALCKCLCLCLGRAEQTIGKPFVFPVISYIQAPLSLTLTNTRCTLPSA